MTARGDRAAALAHEVGARYGTVASVTRFPTGLCHHVFDVDLGAQGRVVVRVADPEQRRLLVGALAWSARLQPLGVPLPEVLDHDVRAPMPYLVLERLPGTDLGAGARRPDGRRAPRAGAGRRRGAGGSGVARAGRRLRVQRRPGGATAAALVGRRRGGEPAAQRRAAPQRAGSPSRPARARVAGGGGSTSAPRRRPAAAVPRRPHDQERPRRRRPALRGRRRRRRLLRRPARHPRADAGVARRSRVEQRLRRGVARRAGAGRAGRAAFDLLTAVFCLDIASEHGVVFNRDEPSVVDDDRVERLLALARLSARAAAAR